MKFGDRVRDKISGAVGIYGGRTDYFTGCVHIGIIPTSPKEDGSLKDWLWLDEARVELVKAGAVKLAVVQGTGGPMPHPSVK